MQVGAQTIKFDNMPVIISKGSVVGPKEGQGTYHNHYDFIITDPMWGEENWEKAESKILRKSISLARNKIGSPISDQVRYIYAGDLLNQLVASTFAVRELSKPFFGIYGACSTMGEAMILAAMAVDGKYADYTIAATSSHYCSAEKQFRYPLEYGGQKKEFSTWTVTGSGAVIIGNSGQGPIITYGIPGKIMDLGIKDVSNMGAAMAPAAADTIKAFFKDVQCGVEDIDCIITGDLGRYGRKILITLLESEGIFVSDKCYDCGANIFAPSQKETNAGGSGCGCAAVTLCGYILDRLEKKEWNRVLFVPTGALLSTITSNEGESIPGIAHGVLIENRCIERL